MTFREALLARTGAKDQPSLKAVAEGAGVSYEQLKKVKQGKSLTTNVEDAVLVARFFGLTIEEFLDAEMVADRDETVQLYRKLSVDERRLLRDVSRVRASRPPPASE